MSSVITEVGGQFIDKAFSGILWIGIAFIVLGALGFVSARGSEISFMMTSNISSLAC